MKQGVLLAFLLFGTGCAVDLSTVETAPDPERRRTKREIITTAAAPTAIGPYSQAIRVGDTLYLSGQLGVDPATGRLVDGGVQPQTRQALANCRTILEAAGFGIADVVQAKVFLADLDDYAAMNAVYAEVFRHAPPARAAVQVARIPLDARVEIMLTAVRTD
jgi:reactive intermediate/imine deaminase